MVKNYAGLVLLSAAILFTMGVGADFASYDAERSVHIAVVADDQELIGLKANPPYSFIDEGTGKLVIDISSNNPNWESEFGEGISPDSKYDFDCIFEVSNDLWENTTISVTVTSDNELIKVYSDDASTAQESVNFMVDAGDSACVGMEFTATGKLPGDTIAGTVTIQAERAGS